MKTPELTVDEALAVTAETLHQLFLDGKNKIVLTTDDDEQLTVWIVKGADKVKKEKDE